MEQLNGEGLLQHLESHPSMMLEHLGHCAVVASACFQEQLHPLPLLHFDHALDYLDLVHLACQNQMPAAFGDPWLAHLLWC